MAAIAAGPYRTLAIHGDGTVTPIGLDAGLFAQIAEWRNCVDAALSFDHAVGLTRSGGALAAGSDAFGQCGVGSWSDLRLVAAAGGYTLGLRADGSVLVSGENRAFAWLPVQVWPRETGR